MNNDIQKEILKQVVFSNFLKVKELEKSDVLNMQSVRISLKMLQNTLEKTEEDFLHNKDNAGFELIRNKLKEYE